MTDRSPLTHRALAERARELVAKNERRARQERPQLPPQGSWHLIRSGSGLSQRQVAALIGVSPAAVSRWEAGLQVPREDIADDYALALRVMSELAVERGKEIAKQRTEALRNGRAS